jgi:elongation factor G
MDSGFKGLICLLKMRAFYFEGKSGETVVEDAIPDNYLEEAKASR